MTLNCLFSITDCYRICIIAYSSLIHLLISHSNLPSSFNHQLIMLEDVALIILQVMLLGAEGIRTVSTRQMGGVTAVPPVPGMWKGCG